MHPAMHTRVLPLPRGRHRVTRTVDALRVGGWQVTRYVIRHARAGAEERSGPDALGPVRGFGVSVERPDGTEAFCDETRGEDESRETFRRAAAQLRRRHGGGAAAGAQDAA